MSKWRLKFEDYKECLQNNKIILRSKQRFKSKAHNVFTENVNKIALSFNDDKTLQSFNSKIISVWNKCCKSCKEEFLLIIKNFTIC